MQHGSVNGTSHHHERVTPEPETDSGSLTALTSVPESAISHSPSLEPKEDEVGTASDHPEGPPSKKRRLTESLSSRRSTPRPPSPPWKKVGIDGPTSFVQDGRRKSSRFNTLPPELQPASGKRQTRAAQQQYVNKTVSRATVSAASSPLSGPQSQSQAPGKLTGGKGLTNGTESFVGSRATPSGRRQPSQVPVSKPSNTRIRSRSLASSHTSHRNGTSPRVTRLQPMPSAGQPADEDAESDNETPLRVPRLRFRVNKPSLAIQHPAHVLRPRKYPSFREWLQNDDLILKDDGIISVDEAYQEAQRRRAILRAVEPGGILSPDVCSAYLPEPQEEPPQQYSHQDHLVAHALYFKKLLDQEHRRHRSTAKLLAQWCADAWRKRHKDPEDILKEQQEEMRGKRKQLVKDLQKMFDLARAEMDRIRLARWEEERKVEDQQALDRAIKQSTMLFEKRRREILGEVGSDMADTSDVDDDNDDESETDDSALDDDDDDESNMSSAESETEDEHVADDDEGLTAEELRRKYAHLPETRDQSDASSTASSDRSGDEIDAVADSPHVASDRNQDRSIADDDRLAQIEVEEVDPMLLDDSDESTDMDDDSDDDMSDEDDGSDAEDSDDGPGLLGFFSSNAVAGLHSHPAEDDDEEQDEYAESNQSREGLTGDEDDEEEPGFPDEVTLIPTEPATASQTDRATSRVSDAEAETTAPAAVLRAGVDEAQAVLVTATDGALKAVVPKKATTEEGAVEITFTPSDHLDKEVLPEVPAERQRSGHSREASSEASPETYATKPSEPESISSYDAPTEKALPLSESPHPSGLKTQIPHLLRGTLREYQHYGLDWLAGLYNNNINGILADEMGLGKTIQTIALLAHLAVEHEVWGPHLVVVPTSVMLNWEMEFKKWCPGFKIMTYYGTQEERKQKRRGWTDDNSWNVLITSYQLVLQDQQVLKRRAWHYMVLDEAHNIKNFRSQRWQALLTFRTRARLLLTGTPLQNNLTELWSLLFFLMPSDEDGSGMEGFADLRNFSEWFRRPVEQILEHGRDTMDDEAKRVVNKLHTVLRPYILRRLKADVEKQMPAKYEHVVYCRLSKRQRYLYDGFMSRAQTKETLASGNYLSIINCLMQLRKVCNHPDLFETRPISTSFAMPKSVASEYAIKEHLVRKKLLFEHPLSQLDLDFLNLVPISREDISRRLADDSTRLMAYGPFEKLRERQYKRTNWRMGFDGSSIQSVLDSLENAARKKRMQELERSLYFESKRHGRRPIYGRSLIDFVTVDTKQRALSNAPSQGRTAADWLSSQSSVLASMVLSIEERARSLEGYIQRFACVTPAAVAASVTEAALTPIETRHLPRSQRFPPYDPFHEAQMRLSIAFPDKRLLQYDCGKLQRLDKLLRDLKAGGHRALIFTQMTKMLDILEQFLNIHGHRYLRLDGTTKVEQRQILTDRFNNDDRILAFILSTRSGGLGINLTGADTVIFYDLDWNPAMDKQCQDRCHRIGQTRDVHIYRFVSEYTIESNILRKANQKRMLDDVVIQEGEFTTDYFTKADVREMIGQEDALVSQDEASAAMDRVLDTRSAGASRAFESAEDKEDIDAAKNAQKELEHADDGDFEDRSVSHSVTQAGTPLPIPPSGVGGGGFDDGIAAASPAGVQGDTPGAQLIGTPQVTHDDEEIPVEPRVGHIDDYFLRFMEWYMKDEPLVLPPDKNLRKSKKGKEHRMRKRRR